MQGQDKKDNKFIVVVGDIMLDEYVFGTVSRVSPESCCPILLSQRTSIQLGGAANVAFQISHLGQKVYLAGIIGKDEEGDTLCQILAANAINDKLVFIHESITTKKIRFVNDVHQQMFRVDKEEQSLLTKTETQSIISFMQENANNIDCIVLSDYDKGVLTSETCQTIIRTANYLSINTIVDIKVPDMTRYLNAYIIKGNLKEITAFFPDSEKSNPIEDLIRILKEKAHSSGIVVTLGKDGIIGIDENNNIIKHSAHQLMVYDVTGAGDIVTAYMGALVNNMSLDDVMNYANKAASIKVSRFGNSHVSFNEIFPGDSKIRDTHDILSLRQGKTLVFTNGCFDIFHAGHADLLHYAKSRGDILVVGINSDESVKRLKGKGRPINNLLMRTKVLSSIIDVDYIVCFEEDTPERIIKEIHPDVLIKGGDYNTDSIVGSDFVLSNGGKVETMPVHFHQSTSKILSSL